MLYSQQTMKKKGFEMAVLEWKVHDIFVFRDTDVPFFPKLFHNPEAELGIEAKHPKF